MGNITKYKTVQVPYTVETVSAPYISRLLGKMASPRQLPWYGEHTVGSMTKYSDTGDSWGWEVSKASYREKDEFVWVNYYRHREMASTMIEIEAIRKYLIDLGFEVSEPTFRYGNAWRRNSDGEYVDYQEETSSYITVRKPVSEFTGHCQTCSCKQDG